MATESEIINIADNCVGVEPDRELATVVKILTIEPIKGADFIELATVLGYQCVISKSDNFKPNDLVIYFRVDSILDITDPNMDFMAESKGRLKTMRKKNVLSQGLLAPLSWLINRDNGKYNEEYITSLVEGDDVTLHMGVKKYVAPEELGQYISSRTKVKGIFDDREDFPDFLKKTDEYRLQDKPRYMIELQKKPIIITRKEDGQSGTFFLKDGKFGICGRNYMWIQPSNDARTYYHIAEKYGMEEKLRSIGRNIAIQGEIIGPKIGGNRLNQAEYTFEVFKIWDIDNKMFLSWNEVKSICAKHDLMTVPELKWPINKELTVKNFIEFTEDVKYVNYGKGIFGEGIVVQTLEPPISSFKIVSRKYLEKHNL